MNELHINSDENRSWYYAKLDKQYGPVSEVAIYDLISSGFLASTDLVWQRGETTWSKVADRFPKTPLSPASSRPIPAPILLPPQSKPKARDRRDEYSSSRTIAWVFLTIVLLAGALTARLFSTSESSQAGAKTPSTKAQTNVLEEDKPGASRGAIVDTREIEGKYKVNGAGLSVRRMDDQRILVSLGTYVGDHENDVDLFAIRQNNQFVSEYSFEEIENQGSCRLRLHFIEKAVQIFMQGNSETCGFFRTDKPSGILSMYDHQAPVLPDTTILTNKIDAKWSKKMSADIDRVARTLNDTFDRIHRLWHFPSFGTSCLVHLQLSNQGDLKKVKVISCSSGISSNTLPKAIESAAPFPELARLPLLGTDFELVIPALGDPEKEFFPPEPSVKAKKALSREEIESYFNRAFIDILSGLVYPPIAVRNEEEGTTKLLVKFSRDGTILSANVIGTSGHKTLDDAALNLFTNGTKARPVPEGLSPEKNVFETMVPVSFSLQ